MELAIRYRLPKNDIFIHPISTRNILSLELKKTFIEEGSTTDFKQCKIKKRFRYLGKQKSAQYGAKNNWKCTKINVSTKKLV